MKKFLLLLVLVMCSYVQVSMAQKVKIKKGVFIVEGTPYVKATNLWSDGNSQFKSVHDDTTVYLVYSSYKYSCMRSRAVGKTFVEEVGSCTAYKVMFFDSGKEMYTRMLVKELVRELYNLKVIDAEGKFHEEKVDQFIKLYGEDKQYGL